MARFWKLTLAISFLIFEVACSLASLDGTVARITAITLAPETASVPSGTIQRFSAIATFNDGTTRDVTDEVDWGATSTQRGLITMVSGVKGGVRALQVGAEAVTAVSANGVAGTASLTVTPATLVKVVVTGDYNPSFRALTKSFTATGIFTDGSTQDVTDDATWAVSDSDILVGSGVNDGEYSASIVSPGAATVSATYQGFTGSTEVVVANATLVGIELEAPDSFTSLPAGYFVPLAATGTYSDGTVMDLTSAVTWSSADDAVATVSNATGYYGRVTGVSPGTVTITATIDGVSETLDVSITNATLASLALSQSSVTTYKPLKTALTVTGTFSDASTLDVTKSVTWSSANPTIATVSIDDATMGEVTAVKQGSTTITATKDAISAAATFLVLHYELQSIAITLGSSTLPEGFPQTATAIATFSDGTTVDVTDQVTWTSANGTAVFPSPTDPGTLIGGAVDANYSSSGDVTASLGNVTSPAAPVTVVEATLASITISPESPSVSVGGTSSLTATGNFSNETTLPLTRFVKWTSSARAYATVKNSPAAQKGTVTGVAIGSSTISAKWNSSTPNVTGTATLAVDGAPGTLDVSYGADGIIELGATRVPVSDSSNPVHIQTALQSDDKIVVPHAYHDAGENRYYVQVIRYTAEGTADAEFDGDSGNDNGFVRIPVGSGDAYGRGAAVQSDGKIVVVGSAGSDGFVMRLNSDGSTDSAFATSGVATISDATLYNVVVTSDNRIVAAGVTAAGKGLFAGFNSSGAVDSSFGTAGITLTSNDVAITQLAIRPNGKFVGLGAGTLAQLSADGTVDSSFDGSSGWNGEIPLSEGGWPGYVEAMALDSTGGVFIGGGARRGPWARTLVPIAARVSAGGYFDSNFLSDDYQLHPTAARSAEGLVLLAEDSNAYDCSVNGHCSHFSAFRTQSDGKVVGLMVGMWRGNSYEGYQYTFLTRFDATSIDRTFGDSGLTRLSIHADRMLDLQIQSDGKIVAIGQSHSGTLIFFRIWD